MTMTVSEARTTLKHVARVSFDEKRGTYHLEYTDRSEKYQTADQCRDILTAMQVLRMNACRSIATVIRTFK